MALTIPPAVNYPSPLVALPSRVLDTPPEGNHCVPIEIDWVSMGGTSKCVNFNLQNNATLNFSRIVAVKVDNSQCGSDVQFTFPDTGDTLLIPAYESAIVPVFTNGQQFFVQQIGVSESVDVTRAQILNFLPPPISILESAEQNSKNVSANGLALGTYPIIAAGISGTLEQLSGFLSYSAATVTFGMQVTVQDGSSNALAVASLSGVAGDKFSGFIFQLSQISGRFANGLNYIVGGSVPTSAASSIAINAFTRTP